MNVIIPHLGEFIVRFVFLSSRYQKIFALSVIFKAIKLLYKSFRRVCWTYTLCSTYTSKIFVPFWMGENWLVPPRFIFEIIPRFLILSTELSTQLGIMEVLKSAQSETNLIVFERCIRAALVHVIHPATYRTYRLGWEVLAFFRIA